MLNETRYGRCTGRWVEANTYDPPPGFIGFCGCGNWPQSGFCATHAFGSCRPISSGRYLGKSPSLRFPGSLVQASTRV